jgi:ABC-type multidrug transport system ATPase subunit
VGDISSTCSRIALLKEGKVVFNGPPEDLADKARGKVWRVNVASPYLDSVKLKYPVISSVPSEDGYQIRLVADRYEEGPAEAVEPNLEDAYVDFMRTEDGQEDGL